MLFQRTSHMRLLNSLPFVTRRTQNQQILPQRQVEEIIMLNTKHTNSISYQTEIIQQILVHKIITWNLQLSHLMRVSEINQKNKKVDFN